MLRPVATALASCGDVVRRFNLVPEAARPTAASEAAAEVKALLSTAHA